MCKLPELQQNHHFAFVEHADNNAIETSQALSTEVKDLGIKKTLHSLRQNLRLNETHVLQFFTTMLWQMGKTD